MIQIPQTLFSIGTGIPSSSQVIDCLVDHSERLDDRLFFDAIDGVSGSHDQGVAIDGC